MIEVRASLNILLKGRRDGVKGRYSARDSDRDMLHISCFVAVGNVRPIALST